MRGLGPIVLACLTAHPAAAQQRLVSWPEAIGVVALTGITFVNDRGIRSTIQGHHSSFRNSAAYLGNAFGNARYVYPTLFFAAYGGRVIGSDGVYDVSWRALKSTALAGAATIVLKSLLGRRRPEVSPDNPYRFNPISFTYNSFPSGHTTTAFALATSLAMETKGALSDVVLYGLAATTAFARMHVDKHWASDTVVGAGIGILAARYIRRHDASAGTGAGSVTIAGSVAF